MNVSIKRPIFSEIEEIHSLFEKTIKQTFKSEELDDDHELITELINDQKNLIDLDFKTDGKEVFFLVAETEGRIAGTTCHRPCSEVILECSQGKAKGMQEIGSVYILPEFQGKGLCKLLLNSMYITMKAKGFSEFWLDSGYTIARKVWKKLLGPPTIIMDDYWAPGAHHHLWLRALDDLDIRYDIVSPPKHT